MSNPSPAIRLTTDILNLIVEHQHKVDEQIRNYKTKSCRSSRLGQPQYFVEAEKFLELKWFALLDYNIFVNQRHLVNFTSTKVLDPSIYVTSEKFDNKGFLAMRANYTETMKKSADKFSELIYRYVTIAETQKT